MDNLRVVLINIVSSVLAFLSPIQDFMTAIVILFSVNFLCGLIADIIHGDGWNTKKALTFIAHCFVFFGLATFIFVCGHFMHNQTGAVQCVSYICYVAFYIYFLNILRNVVSVIHEHSDMHDFLSFIYWVLSFKFVERIPYMKEWQYKKKKNDKR